MVHETHTENTLLSRDDCTLVVIDVQEKLMPVISERKSVEENIIRLARFANIVGIPVVITEQEKLGPTVPQLKQELAATRPVPKVHFNCFSCEEFKDEVSKIGRRTLILTGVEAHICVLQTALHGLDGHDIHVVGDAVSSRVPENRRLAIERMQRCGATITSTEMFIYEILQKAGTDEFRATLPLVK